MGAPAARAVEAVREIVGWYFRVAYGRWEGRGCVPYYCDPDRVGYFAVAPAALARGDEEALFRLLVATAMFQVRRDVNVMAIQRAMPARAARDLTTPRRLRVLVEGARCEHVSYAEAFDVHCSVARDLARGRGVCDHRPRTPCHVKAASQAMRRMGDMGKIPTSAWLHLTPRGGLTGLLAAAVRATPDPGARAVWLAAALAEVYRVGRKLATMYVTALSVPALAPGLAPWFPAVDGHDLVVVDTNVARVVDALRSRGARESYEARARWVRRVARAIDLRAFDPALPACAPRVVQQAMYLYRSAANRAARGDPCAAAGGRPRHERCPDCVRLVCPFAAPVTPRSHPRSHPGGDPR